MRSRVLLLTALLLAPAAALAQRPSDSVVAITGVTVIDVERGRPLPALTVVVRGTRIADLGPTARVRVPPGARVVDGRGKFLIPGLWDMHVHTLVGIRPTTELWPAFFPLFVANGVTGVRDMATNLELLRGVRRLGDSLAAGTRLGPRLLGSGAILDGLPATLPHQIPVANADQARRVVDSLVDGGAALIKVYDRLSRDAYFAAADQAQRRGIPLVGHVPWSVTHVEASDAGQLTFEHVAELPVMCSDESRAIRDRFAALLRDSTLSADSVRALRESRDSALVARFDLRECGPVFARIARNGTWQVTSIGVPYEVPLRHLDSAWRADTRLRQMPAALREEWATIFFSRLGDARSGRVALWQALVETQRQTARGLHAAGVRLLAGTDAWRPYNLPGYSLHEQLAILVESGLSPLEALRTTTLNPARFLHATDSLGAVARGKLADLVLLDGNPLADIRNTTNIRAVVMNGRYLDRAALDALIAAAERR